MRQAIANKGVTQYIFIIEAECDMNVITRVHTIFTRRRVRIPDFQSVQLNNGERQRILMIVEETRGNVLKLYRQIARQVDVMSVNLFESVG